MEELINGLLRFSRLGRQPLVRQPVSMAGIVQQVLAEVRPEPPDRKVEVVVHPLPDAVGDGALLKQVWTNLLSNAFKFTRACETPVVEIGCKEQDGEQVFFVRDNGAGFDPQYAERLFGVFQRLHRADEFEGTGVGLSIVQRIVHRHGGRIWADGAVNKGATFQFTLPHRAEP
jgi:light-regulated signal transduction histidine kinase (bacteriophytochrome)